MSAARIFGRFISGRPLDGRRRTNATFLRAGDRVLNKGGRASQWALLAGWKRAAWRLGITFGLLLVGLGELIARTLTNICLCLVVVGLLGWFGWWAYSGARRLRFHVRWVRPLARALGPKIGVNDWPSEWIHIPLRFFDGETHARLDLPEHFARTTESMRLIKDVVTDKLGLEDPLVEWHLTGRGQHVTIRAATPPPDRVSLGDVAPVAAALTDQQLVMGLGRKSLPVLYDLSADSPHCLISASTGAGKSALVRSLVAQALHRGGVVLCLDVKRISQRWLDKLPSTFVARDAEVIHDSLLWLRGELDRRTLIADEHADDDGNLPPELRFTRLWLVVEEFNALAGRLTAYWQTIREARDPIKSPAITALADTLYMGRAIDITVIATAPHGTAATIGDPSMREQFGVRVLARYTQQHWKMLVGDIWPPPKKSKTIGRWQMAAHGVAHEFQGPMIVASQAREHALAGIVSAFPELTLGRRPTPTPINIQPATTPPATTIPPDKIETDTEQDASKPAVGRVVSVTSARWPVVSDGSDHVPDDRLVSLLEACRTGVLTMAVSAVRTARARDGGFPGRRGERGLAHLYRAGDLRRWAANRPRAGERVLVPVVDPAGVRAGYERVHGRLASEFGPARTFECGMYGDGSTSDQVGCGKASASAQWAYDHQDPAEVRDEFGRYPYSNDLGRYVALCRSCHKLFDNAQSVL